MNFDYLKAVHAGTALGYTFFNPNFSSTLAGQIPVPVGKIIAIAGGCLAAKTILSRSNISNKKKIALITAIATPILFLHAAM